VHDLDREQLELRDLVRNSAINRTISGSSVAWAASSERRWIYSTLLYLHCLYFVHKHAHILVEVHILFRQVAHMPVAQVVVRW
jgi:hypothetical protein